MKTLLAALVLLAGGNRLLRDGAVRGAVVQPAAAQPAAKDRTPTRPREEPERQADQRPGMESDPGVANPFAPATDLDASRISSAQLGPARGPARRAPFNRTLSMPANPFSAIPPGATAQRQAAVYGTGPAPAPAVGGGGKAFSGYHAPSPISPYMGLYARPTLGLDNYNAYVRPQLEQQALNQQVETRFHALEPDRSPADASARSFDQLFTIGPGTSGATFMNFQPYYPNYPSSR